jgi:hypothetical protein
MGQMSHMAYKRQADFATLTNMIEMTSMTNMTHLTSMTDMTHTTYFKFDCDD